MSKSLNATKNRTTGNRSKSNFIAPLYRHGPERSPVAQTSREIDGDGVILPPRSHLESGVCAPKGDEYGTPYRAEIPVRGRARPRRSLVVPLRGFEKPAVLRRHAQGQRVRAGEIRGGQGREALAVRLQAHPQPSFLRLYPQDALGAGFALFPRGGPAAFRAVVGAERAFHGAAGDAPGEVAPHAVIVHVGEADPESGEARLAQAREDRAQIGHALDFLEPLVDIQAELFRTARAGEFHRPAARDARGHDPQIDAPAVHVGGLVRLP